jgi:hypothetical protein
MENETYSQQAATLAFYEGIDGAQSVSVYLPTVQSITTEQLRAAVSTHLLGWITVGARPEGEK